MLRGGQVRRDSLGTLELRRFGDGTAAMASNYYVYIMASWGRVLYIGMTNDLHRRIWQHKAGEISGFTSRYNVNRLVYYEHYSDPTSAISREKELKGWLRANKIALIELSNPTWRDLYTDIAE